jgi:hypothetical protein
MSTALLDAPLANGHLVTAESLFADASGVASTAGLKDIDSQFVMLMFRTTGRSGFTCKLPKGKKAVKSKGKGKKKEAPAVLTVETQINGATVEGEAARDVSHTITLLEEPVKARLNLAFGRAEAYVNSPAHTWPHPITKGIRLLPQANAVQFFANWKKVEEAFRKDIEAFLEVYPGQADKCRERWEAKLGKAAYDRFVGPKFKTEAELRDLMAVRISPLTLTFKSAEDSTAVVTQLAADLRESLSAALEKAAEQLAQGQKLAPSSFTALKNLIEATKGFEVFCDPEMLEEAAHLDGLLNKAIADAEAAKDGNKPMTPAIQAHKEGLLAAINKTAAAVQSEKGFQSTMKTLGLGMAARVVQKDDE